MLKECLLSMSRDDKRATNVLKSRKGRNSSYEEISRNVYQFLNEFLKETELISGGFGRTTDFLMSEGSKSHTGVFYDTRPVEFLVASDYNSINQIPSFLGAIEDTFRENVYNPEKSWVTTSFVELLRVIHRYNRDFRREGNQVFPF